MMNEKDLREIIAKNLIHYRKMNNLTQLELAEKINYSDKAISKWERGESIPDIFILNMLAEMYGITLNDLVSEKKVIPQPSIKKTHFLVTIISFGLIWLIATFVFVILRLTAPDLNKTWLAFIYAIPVSLIVLAVFSELWYNILTVFIFYSLLSWSIPLSIYLTADYHKLWLLFIVIIPLQFVILLWFILKRHLKLSKKQ